MRNLAERAKGTSEMRLNRPGGKLSLKIVLGKSIGALMGKENLHNIDWAGEAGWVNRGRQPRISSNRTHLVRNGGQTGNDGGGDDHDQQ